MATDEERLQEAVAEEAQIKYAAKLTLKEIEGAKASVINVSDALSQFGRAIGIDNLTAMQAVDAVLDNVATFVKAWMARMESPWTTDNDNQDPHDAEREAHQKRVSKRLRKQARDRRIAEGLEKEEEDANLS